MTALEVYKLPFTCWGGSKILTSENNMALDFIARVNEESKQKIVNLLNGESTNYITDSVAAKEGEISINGTPILLVRGWGHLTGTGALHLPVDEAARLQDEFADWVVLRLQGKV